LIFIKIQDGEISKKRRPTKKTSHPGKILKNLWLDELGYSQSHFADLLVRASGGLSKKSTMQSKLNEVTSGKRSMSAEFAVLTSKVLKSGLTHPSVQVPGQLSETHLVFTLFNFSGG
jgi:plasmid maintenance system antidote protein VapI